MLTNVTIISPPRDLALITAFIVGKRTGPVVPTLLEPGVYECAHWSFEHYVAERLERHWNDFDMSDLESYVSPYIVCDNVQQAREYWVSQLEDPTEKYTMCVVPLYREEQSERGGWRWHKWGEYVGKQNSTHEYLYDDKHIDLVYTAHLYKVVY